MVKDVYVTVTLDAYCAKWLTMLADLETDGNRSMLVRQLIRRAGQDRVQELASERASAPGDPSKCLDGGTVPDGH